MIPMPMTPYDGINFLIVHTTLAQDLIDVFGNVDSRYTVLDRGIRDWRMVPPVFPASKVEHDGFAQLLVLDQEGKGGHVHVFMPILYRLNEGFRRHDDIGGGINNGHFHCRVGLEEIQGRVRHRFDLVTWHDNCLTLNQDESMTDFYKRQEVRAKHGTIEIAWHSPCPAERWRGKLRHFAFGLDKRN